MKTPTPFSKYLAKISSPDTSRTKKQELAQTFSKLGPSNPLLPLVK